MTLLMQVLSLFTIYADGTNLLLEDQDINRLHANLYTALELIINWIKTNKLNVNVSKTNHIIFQNRSIKLTILHVTL